MLRSELRSMIASEVERIFKAVAGDNAILPALGIIIDISPVTPSGENCDLIFVEGYSKEHYDNLYRFLKKRNYFVYKEKYQHAENPYLNVHFNGGNHVIELMDALKSWEQHEIVIQQKTKREGALRRIIAREVRRLLNVE